MKIECIIFLCIVHLFYNADSEQCNWFPTEIDVTQKETYFKTKLSDDLYNNLIQLVHNLDQTITSVNHFRTDRTKINELKQALNQYTNAITNLNKFKDDHIAKKCWNVIFEESNC